MENEFTEAHKDSFVRSKKDEPAKKPAPAAPKPAAPKAADSDSLDDYVPDQVGKVVDNVFGKLDNLVNDAADYLFGNKKKGGLLEGDQFQKQAPPQVPPLQPQKPPALTPLQTPVQAAPPAAPAPTVPPKAQPAAKPAAKAPAAPTIKTLSTLQGSRKPEMITPVMPESKSKFDGPVVARTTSISELELPLEILDDPDLPRYFDQMKLYEGKVVEGGLCGLPQFEATMALRRGKWKNDFGIKFEDLKWIDPGINPMEMAKSRFNGMRPVYKAQAQRFGGREALIKAIEEDINAYLANKDSKIFHPFIYQVVTSLR